MGLRNYFDDKKPLTGKKKILIEYIIYKLIEWYRENYTRKNGVDLTVEEFNIQENDFSKLKIIKLHFFVVAVQADSNSLLDVFNRFYALPYGHVELDVYDAIQDGLDYFEIDNATICIKGVQSWDEASSMFSSLLVGQEEHQSEVDRAIEKLKGINPDFINYTAFDLVELSHLWLSWRVAYKIAQGKNQKKYPIPANVIKGEEKFFFAPV